MATPKQILRIQELKINAEKAYDIYNEACAKLLEEEDEKKHVVEIEPQDNKNWLRLTLVDNSKRLKRGETVVGISIIKKCGAKVEYLKNKPKE